MRHDDMDLPTGYEYVRVAGIKLAVPNSQAQDCRRVIEERQNQETTAVREEHRLRSEATKAEEEAQRRAEAEAQAQAAKPPPFADPAEPGWHRVLPRFEELVNGTTEADVKVRNADKDVRERLETLRQQLVERGPDRRVAKPADWRVAMANMEETLPHFMAPIQRIRQTLAMAEVASVPVRIPPMLLLGPPGVGKTYFSHQLAEMLGASHASIAFDQPTAGSQLCGSDKYWGNSECGMLFDLICRGEFANPVILLDELDKSSRSYGRAELDPLGQLHGTLEPQTARRLRDISVDIEFDASLVTYIATANSLHGLQAPILSRFEIFYIEPPGVDESIELARRIAQGVLQRLGLNDRIKLERKCIYVLARMSPRLILHTVEKVVAAALEQGVATVGEEDIWRAVGLDAVPKHLH